MNNKEIIEYALNGEPTRFKEAVSEKLTQKAGEALEQKRISIAQDFLNTEKDS